MYIRDMENAKTNTMKNLKVRIGSRLYYTDNKQYVGEVVKILKRTVWYKDLNGNVTKNFSLNFAKDMLNSFDEHVLDMENLIIVKTKYNSLSMSGTGIVVDTYLVTSETEKLYNVYLKDTTGDLALGRFNTFIWKKEIGISNHNCKIELLKL